MAIPRLSIFLLIGSLGFKLFGCSGTPFGENLSSSFPPNSQQEDQQPVQVQAAAEPKSAAKPNVVSAKQNLQLKPVESSQALEKTSNPVPYRLTIRLPKADPAAPAEVVTQALRAAGVPFEVETIERMSTTAALPDQPGTSSAPQVKEQPAEAR